MKHVTIVLMALLIPTAATAKGECKEDRAKFCKDAAHVDACLDEHKAELSEACKAKREAKANKKKTEGSAKMGKEEGTHAEPGHGSTPESETSKVDQPERRNVPSDEATKPAAPQ